MHSYRYIKKIKIKKKYKKILYAHKKNKKIEDKNFYEYIRNKKYIYIYIIRIRSTSITLFGVLFISSYTRTTPFLLTRVCVNIRLGNKFHHLSILRHQQLLHLFSLHFVKFFSAMFDEYMNLWDHPYL